MDFNRMIKQYKCKIKSQVSRFEGCKPVNIQAGELDYKNECVIKLEESEWITHLDQNIVGDCCNITANFNLVKGESPQSNVGIRFEFDEWSQDNYVVMPAAAYNGNRFSSRKLSYPPMITEDYNRNGDLVPIITDVPRLKRDTEYSSIQLLTGDLSTPAIGFFDPHKNKAFWLITQQSTFLGNSGIEIHEDGKQGKCCIAVTAPGVRHNLKYTMCNTDTPCDDKAADFTEGITVSLTLKAYFFECSNIVQLYDYFSDIRKVFSIEQKRNKLIPFSAAWRILEDKYNKWNWVERQGYYKVGSDDSLYSKWQIGWIGGMLSTYTMLMEGSEITRERTLRNFDFIFPEGQGDFGLFYGIGDGIKWYGDNHKNLEDRSCHLVRKSADALYYIVKQLMFLKSTKSESYMKEEWLYGTRKCADAFVKLWQKHGQFGQFINVDNGEIIIGGTTSGAVIPAALVAAYEFFNQKEYLDVAEQSAVYYWDRYITKGLTNGGPGEICQCPDSESSYAMLESFIALYEVTQSHHWLDKAQHMANQFMTWCVSYDYTFPTTSTFAKMEMQSLGTVYANVQNKHSAPGICTHSGLALLKLFRYTGDKKYLDLVREIAGALPQYMSRADRPIASQWDKEKTTILPPGFICERVNMSDWEGKERVGEVFNGSCWPEVSLMLTYAEIPGVYIQVDTGLICVIDHVEAEIVVNDGNSLAIRLTNPTMFDAVIKVLAEKQSESGSILSNQAVWNYERIKIGAGEKVDIEFGKI